jgi:hypothetical protein
MPRQPVQRSTSIVSTCTRSIAAAHFGQFIARSVAAQLAPPAHYTGGGQKHEGRDRGLPRRALYS